MCFRQDLQDGQDGGGGGFASSQTIDRESDRRTLPKAERVCAGQKGGVFRQNISKRPRSLALETLVS